MPNRTRSGFTIDSRENRKIKSLAEDRGGKITRLQIITADTGDFKCIDRAGTEYRFERKTLRDYERSCADGRLHGQQRRLKEEKGSNLVAGYILEGFGDAIKDSIRNSNAMESVRRSIWRLEMDPDFITVHTRNPKETIDFVPKYTE